MKIFQEKLRATTKEGKILELITNSGSRGVENWVLAKYALKYTSVISELRADGHKIVAVRQQLNNGRWSNTWRYYLNEQ